MICRVLFSYINKYSYTFHYISYFEKFWTLLNLIQTLRNLKRQQEPLWRRCSQSPFRIRSRPTGQPIFNANPKSTILGKLARSPKTQSLQLLESTVCFPHFFWWKCVKYIHAIVNLWYKLRQTRKDWTKLSDGFRISLRRKQSDDCSSSSESSARNKSIKVNTSKKSVPEDFPQDLEMCSPCHSAYQEHWWIVTMIRGSMLSCFIFPLSHGDNTEWRPQEEQHWKQKNKLHGQVTKQQERG